MNHVLTILLMEEELLRNIAAMNVTLVSFRDQFVWNNVNKFGDISEAYSELSQISKTVFFAKIVKGFHPVTVFADNLRLRCLTGLWIHLYILKSVQRHSEETLVELRISGEFFSAWWPLHCIKKKFSFEDFFRKFRQYAQHYAETVPFHKIFTPGN